MVDVAGKLSGHKSALILSQSFHAELHEVSENAQREGNEYILVSPVIKGLIDHPVMNFASIMTEIMLHLRLPVN